MRTETLREIKNNLSRVIEALPRTGPVLITKNGKTRALLTPVNEKTDLESLLLTASPRRAFHSERLAVSRYNG